MCASLSCDSSPSSPRLYPRLRRIWSPIRGRRAVPCFGFTAILVSRTTSGLTRPMCSTLFPPGKDVHSPGFYLHLESGAMLRGVWPVASRTSNFAQSPQRYLFRGRKSGARSANYSTGTMPANSAARRAASPADHEFVEDLKLRDLGSRHDLHRPTSLQPEVHVNFAMRVATCRPSPHFSAAQSD